MSHFGHWSDAPKNRISVSFYEDGLSSFLFRSLNIICIQQTAPIIVFFTQHRAERGREGLYAHLDDRNEPVGGEAAPLQYHGGHQVSLGVGHGGGQVLRVEPRTSMYYYNTGLYILFTWTHGQVKSTWQLAVYILHSSNAATCLHCLVVSMVEGTVTCPVLYCMTGHAAAKFNKFYYLAV
jgi:hypothetical protein